MEEHTDAEPTVERGQRPGKRRRSLGRLTRRIALAVAAGLLSVVGAELVLRISATRVADDKTLDAILEACEPLAEGEVGKLKHVLRVRGEPGLVYDLRANFDGVILMGDVPTRLRTNRDGLRAPELAHAKPEGTVRILGIGDSFMMGYGLSEPETFLARIEANLRERFHGVPTEVLNAGVGGYNAAQAVAALREKGLHYDPDLVLLGLIPNDTNPIIYSTRATVGNPLVDPKLRLFAALGFGAADKAESGAAVGGEAGGPTADEWRAFELALDELAALRDAHGFRVLVFSYYTDPQSKRMLEVSGERGLPTANLGRPLRAYMARHGIKNVAGSALALTPKDPHPSALHAQLTADALIEALEQLKLLEDLYGSVGEGSPDRSSR